MYLYLPSPTEGCRAEEANNRIRGKGNEARDDERAAAEPVTDESRVVQSSATLRSVVGGHAIDNKLPKK